MCLPKPLKYLLGGLALLFCVAGAGASWLLGSETGRLWLAGKALELADNTDVQVILDDLTSPSLSHWRAQSLRVSRDKAPLVEVRDLELHWQPGALFKKHLKVNNLSASRVDYYHPASTETASEAGDTPQFPLQLTFDHLAIDALGLHQLPDIQGKALPDYRLVAAIDLFGPDYPLQLQLDLQSLGKEETRLSVKTLAIASDEVQIQGSVVEAPAGLLGSLARWPAGDPLEAQFRLRLAQKDQRLLLTLEELTGRLVDHDIRAAGSLDYHQDDQSLHLRVLELLVDGQRQELRGVYTAANLSAQVDLDRLPLDLVTPWYSDITGGTASGQLELTWQHAEPGLWPDATAALNGDLVYAQQRLVVTLDGDLKNQQLVLRPSVLHYGPAELKVEGLLDFVNPVSDLKGELKHFHTDLLQPWAIPIPEGLTAATDQARFRLQGDMRQPDLTLTTQVRGVYQQQAFNLTLDGQSNLQRGRFQELHLITADAEVNAKGLADWSGGPNDLQLSFQNLRSELLRLAPPQVAEQLPEGLTVTANGEAKLTGSIHQPIVESRSSLTGTYELRGETLPYRLELHGSVTTGGTEPLKISAEQVELFLFDHPTLTLSGHYNAQALDLHLHLDQLPTRALAALGWHGIDGEAEADLRLSGTLEQPRLDGYLEYRDTLPGREGVRLPLTLRTEVATLENRLSLTAKLHRDQESLGQMLISLPADLYLQPRAGPLPLDLHAKGEWELRSLRLFTDLGIHRLEGQTQVDLTFSGDIEQPKVRGQLQLLDGTYHNQVTGTLLENIKLVLTGNGEQVSIQEAWARSGDDGELRLTGAVFWQPERRQLPDAVNLSLALNRATLLQRRDLRGEVEGQVSVTGSFSELWVKGDLEVSPLNASVESAIRTRIPQIQITEIQKVTPAATDGAAQLPVVHLDVRLRADQQAYLRGRGLETELAGRIVITGTLDDPQYRGVFTTRRGRLELFGKRFVLDQGEVRFSNSGAILRIPAVYKTQEIEIRAELHGTAEEPKLNLSSIPALPNDEILSRLIFGKSAQDISAFEAIRLAGALRSLTSGGGFDPVDSTRSMLGVDSLTIDSETGTNGDSSYTLGVGKYINERVYVELGRSSNPSQPWRGSVEIELTPSIMLESRTNQTGGAGTVLMWKRDY